MYRSNRERLPPSRQRSCPLFGAETVDARDAKLPPGLIDSHAHTKDGGYYFARIGIIRSYHAYQP